MINAQGQGPWARSVRIGTEDRRSSPSPTCVRRLAPKGLDNDVGDEVPGGVGETRGARPVLPDGTSSQKAKPFARPPRRGVREVEGALPPRAPPNTPREVSGEAELHLRPPVGEPPYGPTTREQLRCSRGGGAYGYVGPVVLGEAPLRLRPPGPTYGEPPEVAKQPEGLRRKRPRRWRSHRRGRASGRKRLTALAKALIGRMADWPLGQLWPRLWAAEVAKQP